jgi:uncharacterized protein (DUF697 family)
MNTSTEKKRKIIATKIIDDFAKNTATATAIFSQVPGMGITTLSKLYFDMAIEIADLFNHKLETPVARSLVIAGFECHANAIFNKSVLGWIPLIGNVINYKITFTLTQNIGWFFYNHFAETCK